MNFKLDLSDIFNDKRKLSLIYIDLDQYKTVFEVLSYICKVFGIKFGDEFINECSEELSLFHGEWFIHSSQSSEVLRNISDNLKLQRIGRKDENVTSQIIISTQSHDGNCGLNASEVTDPTFIKNINAEPVILEEESPPKINKFQPKSDFLFYLNLEKKTTLSHSNYDDISNAHNSNIPDKQKLPEKLEENLCNKKSTEECVIPAASSSVASIEDSCLFEFKKTNKRKRIRHSKRKKRLTETEFENDSNTKFKHRKPNDDKLYFLKVKTDNFVSGSVKHIVFSDSEDECVSKQSDCDQIESNIDEIRTGAQLQYKPYCIPDSDSIEKMSSSFDSSLIKCKNTGKEDVIKVAENNCLINTSNFSCDYKPSESFSNSNVHESLKNYSKSDINYDSFKADSLVMSNTNQSNNFQSVYHDYSNSTLSNSTVNSKAKYYNSSAISETSNTSERSSYELNKHGDSESTFNNQTDQVVSKNIDVEFKFIPPINYNVDQSNIEATFKNLIALEKRHKPKIVNWARNKFRAAQTNISGSGILSNTKSEFRADPHTGSTLEFSPNTVSDFGISRDTDLAFNTEFDSLPTSFVSRKTTTDYKYKRSKSNNFDYTNVHSDHEKYKSAIVIPSNSTPKVFTSRTTSHNPDQKNTRRKSSVRVSHSLGALLGKLKGPSQSPQNVADSAKSDSFDDNGYGISSRSHSDSNINVRNKNSMSCDDSDTNKKCDSSSIEHAEVSFQKRNGKHTEESMDPEIQNNVIGNGINLGLQEALEENKIPPINGNYDRNLEIKMEINEDSPPVYDSTIHQQTRNSNGFESTTKDGIDFESYPIISSLPKVGDIIAAQFLTIDDELCPSYSDYRPVKVVAIQGTRLVLGSLNDETKSESHTRLLSNRNLDRVFTEDWRELKLPRLIFP